MVIWKDIGVKLRQKVYHVKKIGGRLRFSFVDDYGDVPVARINKQTNCVEEVVNTRGRAYAARKRQAYRVKMK